MMFSMVGPWCAILLCVATYHAMLVITLPKVNIRDIEIVLVTTNELLVYCKFHGLLKLYACHRLA